MGRVLLLHAVRALDLAGWITDDRRWYLLCIGPALSGGQKSQFGGKQGAHMNRKLLFVSLALFLLLSLAFTVQLMRSAHGDVPTRLELR